MKLSNVCLGMFCCFTINDNWFEVKAGLAEKLKKENELMSSHLRWASEEWDENIWPTLLPGGSHCSLSSDHSVNRWNVRTRLWYHRSHLFPSLIVYHWTLKYTKDTKLCTVSPKCSMYIEVVPDVVLTLHITQQSSGGDGLGQTEQQDCNTQNSAWAKRVPGLTIYDPPRALLRWYKPAACRRSLLSWDMHVE